MTSAVLFDHPGPPEVLHWRPVNPVRPRPDEVVIIGGSTAPAPLDIGLLMSKRGSVTATMLRARPADQKAEIIAEAARAHELLESQRLCGKVILDNRTS